MMMLPITPYRSFPPIEVYEGQRYVKGIEAIMLDTASLSVFFQSIVPVVADDEASRVSHPKLFHINKKMMVNILLRLRLFQLATSKIQ